MYRPSMIAWSPRASERMFSSVSSTPPLRYIHIIEHQVGPSQQLRRSHHVRQLDHRISCTFYLQAPLEEYLAQVFMTTTSESEGMKLGQKTESGLCTICQESGFGCVGDAHIIIYSHGGPPQRQLFRILQWL